MFTGNTCLITVRFYYYEVCFGLKDCVEACFRIIKGSCNTSHNCLFICLYHISNVSFWNTDYLFSYKLGIGSLFLQDITLNKMNHEEAINYKTIKKNV